VLLYLVAVCLLAYLLYQFKRLRTNALRLRRSNIKLQHEMEQRRSALEALRASEERFRAIAESANDAIVSADRSGNIVSWNPKAQSIFGYSADEILGSNLTRLMPARYREMHTHGFERWATSVVPHARCHHRADGSTQGRLRVPDRGLPFQLVDEPWKLHHRHDSRSHRAQAPARPPGGRSFSSSRPTK